MSRLLAVHTALLVSGVVLLGTPVVGQQRPNVLLLIVDDMNDWVGCLGDEQAKTPHIDRLAQHGVLFTNAHCSAPICNPSRVATLTGLAPHTTGVYSNSHRMRKHAPDAVTLPQLFRVNGYLSAGGGKVFHDVPPHCDDPASWDEYFWWNQHGPRGAIVGRRWRSPYSVAPDPEPARRPARRITPLTKRNFDWAAVDQPKSDWPDWQVANWANQFLERDHDRPFFLAVGVFRPHVPWFNPTEFVDRFPLATVRVPPVEPDDLDDLGPWARRRALDRNSRHEKVVEFDEWAPAVQAYLASIAFADATVGRVVDALAQSPYGENTIIVFCSDHGYHLGEKGHWHKETLWERSTHVPMIVSAPGFTRGATRCDEAVSLLDVYPTLVELCRLKQAPKLDGASLAVQLSDPAAARRRPALTTYHQGDHAVRDKRWRYIRYSNGEEELYDHQHDPHEWTNLAASSEHATVKQRLREYIPTPGLANP